MIFFVLCPDFAYLADLLALPMTPYRRGAPMPSGAGSSIFETLDLV